jgi:membrane associated rhomboid family serine protease
MFFFPYNTDAPLYHYPIATIGLIIVNFFLFIIGLSLDEATHASLVLTFDAVRPTQWLTMNFMHAGPMHLLGNMLFLWSFGLVVEGKLGWYRFLPIYLGIGILCGAVVQLSMLGSEGSALGASAVIFGVMGMALAWAPKNELSCLLIFFAFSVRVIRFELTIGTMAMIFIGLNLLFFALQGFSFSGEAGHLLGFVIGMPVGIAMLKLSWVDCEGWDVFAVLAGRAGSMKTADEIRDDTEQVLAKADERRGQQQLDERATALGLLQMHLSEGRPRIAYAVFQKNAGDHASGWELPEGDLCRLISGLNQEKMWSESVPLLLQAIGRFPNRQVPMRMHLAKVMAQVEQRPKQALAILSKLPDSLTDAQQQERQVVERFANNAIEEGEVELEIKDW